MNSYFLLIKIKVKFILNMNSHFATGLCSHVLKKIIFKGEQHDRFYCSGIKPTITAAAKA